MDQKRPLQEVGLKLRSALQILLRGWKDDLTPSWREILGEVSPDFGGVDHNLEHEVWEPIFPARKGARIPGAPRGSHIFRALERIEPRRVRVVLLGQAPYPNVAHATGRAFEQGDLLDWCDDRHRVTRSLRRIVQALAAFRAGQNLFVSGDGAWTTLIEAIQSGELRLPAPRELFDSWERQGVLLLNAALTISRCGKDAASYQTKGHLPLWKPVVHRILAGVAARETGHAVFAIWGSNARGLIGNAGVEAAARRSGAWGSRVAAVYKPHPSSYTAGAPAFFSGSNVFAEINEALAQLGTKPIAW
jgi:uracil-DNA glycosylase